MAEAGGSTSVAPPELLEWMRRYASASPEDDVEELLAGVRRALRHTLTHPGRDREAAFSLLAADGALTLAVERLAEHDDDLEARLKALIAALAADTDGVGRSGGTG
jgi:hypothetical protein